MLLCVLNCQFQRDYVFSYLTKWRLEHVYCVWRIQVDVFEKIIRISEKKTSLVFKDNVFLKWTDLTKYNLTVSIREYIIEFKRNLDMKPRKSI